MRRQITLLGLLFILAAGSAYGQAWFDFGLGVVNHTTLLKGSDGNIIYNNTLPAINCTYFSGGKFGFFINANFSYLAIMFADEGGGFERYTIDLGFMGNFCTDISGGPAMTWNLSGDKVRLAVGAGVHFAMPHIPWNDGSGERLINGFSAGLSGKAVLKFKYLYIGLDANFDFWMFESVFEGYDYYGFSVVPAIGYSYNY
jgi:hypothetical protein